MAKVFNKRIGLTLIELMLGLAILVILVGISAKIKSFYERYKCKTSIQTSIPGVTAFLETYLYVNRNKINFDAPIFLTRSASKNWERSNEKTFLQTTESFEATFKKRVLQDTFLPGTESYYIVVRLKSSGDNISVNYPLFFVKNSPLTGASQVLPPEK